MFDLNTNECSTVSSYHPQRDVSCTDTTLEPYEIEEHNFNLVLHNYFLVQKYLKNQSKCSLNFQRTKYSGSKTACLLFTYHSSTTLSTQSTNILEIQLSVEQEETEKGPVLYGRRNTILQANCLEEHRGKWWFSLKDPQQERP